MVKTGKAALFCAHSGFAFALKGEKQMTETKKEPNAYLAQQRTKPVSSWAKPVWDAAKEEGITDGTAPQAFITRQEAVTMIQRATK